MARQFVYGKAYVGSGIHEGILLDWYEDNTEGGKY